MPIRLLAAVAFAAMVGVWTLPAAGVARAPSAAMLRPIEATLSALNTLNAGTMQGTHARNAVIVDEFQPYVWTGVNAPATWLRAFITYARSAKLTNGKGTMQPVRVFDQTNNRAYLVVPTTFTARINGRPATETGTWTFTLQRSGTGWVITTQTWGTITPAM